MPSVNVTINGKPYRMACDEGQEPHLLGLADELNATINQLRGAFGEIGDQRLIVMAAITMADGIAEAKRQLRKVEADMKALREAHAKHEAHFDAAEAEIARAIDTAAERITAAALRLNSDQR